MPRYQPLKCEPLKKVLVKIYGYRRYLIFFVLFSCCYFFSGVETFSEASIIPLSEALATPPDLSPTSCDLQPHKRALMSAGRSLQDR